MPDTHQLSDPTPAAHLNIRAEEHINFEVIEYDSFTTEKGKGNPAGVAYLGTEMLEEKSMQKIAKSIGFNETVFISKSAGVSETY